MLPKTRYTFTQMTTQEPTIEAEVVEIDGVRVDPSVAPKANSRSAYSEWRDWKKWQRRVVQLDARWWPLWLLLGFIALVLLVALGMCALVLFVTYKIAKALLLGFVSLFFPGNHELQRR